VTWVCFSVTRFTHTCALLLCNVCWLYAAVQECHCMLFLTEDNDFAGKEQDISMDEIKDGINGM
jgi:ferredoxin-thioredoxin reductase catalytic subunit